MRRDDPVFQQVAYLCRDLARRGFVIATGGGPGAMEAANLGAHFAELKDTELDAALEVLAAAPVFSTPEGPRAAKAVLDKWPTPNILSLVSSALIKTLVCCHMFKPVGFCLCADFKP